MHICCFCGATYLRLEDKLTCESSAVEVPIINVGTILYDDSYDTMIPIRCYAITRSGHDTQYSFEFEITEGQWGHAYCITGNKMLQGSPLIFTNFVALN